MAWSVQLIEPPKKYAGIFLGDPKVLLSDLRRQRGSLSALVVGLSRALTRFPAESQIKVKHPIDMRRLRSRRALRTLAL